MLLDRVQFGRLVRDWDEAVVAASDASGWWEVQRRERRPSVLHPPASLEDIEALEERIGLPLPPSFRWFLEVSDGAEAAVGAVGRPGEGLLPATRIDRFIRREPRMPHLHAHVPPEGWFEPENDPRDGELAWLLARFVNGPATTLPGHLPHCLAVSGMAAGSAVLLNPLVRDVDGEWECVDFFTHDVSSGFRSFADLLASQRDVLASKRDRYEHLDPEDPDDLDDGTLERWLTSWQVAPPWFRRQLCSSQPPARAVEVLTRLIDAGPIGETARHVARMQGPVALELAQRAWRAAAGRPRTRRPSLRRLLGRPPLTANLLDVASQLSWSQDAMVLAWLVEVLEGHLREDPEFARLRNDPRCAARLGNLSGPVVEQLWHRSGSEVLLIQLVRTARWTGVEDRTRLEKAVTTRLADAKWRQEHRRHLGDLLAVAGAGGQELLPLLRTLRDAPDVPARELATALLRLGDDDRAYAARHLRISELDRLQEVGEELRREHRRARVAAVAGAAPEHQPSTDELLHDLAGHHDPEATNLLMALRGTADDLRLSLALERQRSPASADALTTLALEEPHAWRGLARLGDVRAAQPLLDMLDDNDPEIRLFAARGLRELGEPNAIGQLADRALGDPDPELLCVAAHAASTTRVAGDLLLDRLADLGDDYRRVAEHWRALLAPPSA